MPRKSREKRIEDKLNKLYESTVDLLLDHIESGTNSASIIGTAVKLLKDAGLLKKEEQDSEVDIDLPFDSTEEE